MSPQPDTAASSACVLNHPSCWRSKSRHIRAAQSARPYHTCHTAAHTAQRACHDQAPNATPGSSWAGHRGGTATTTPKMPSHLPPKYECLILSRVFVVHSSNQIRWPESPWMGCVRTAQSEVFAQPWVICALAAPVPDKAVFLSRLLRRPTSHLKASRTKRSQPWRRQETVFAMTTWTVSNSSLLPYHAPNLQYAYARRSPMS